MASREPVPAWPKTYDEQSNRELFETPAGKQRVLVEKETIPYIEILSFARSGGILPSDIKTLIDIINRLVAEKVEISSEEKYLLDAFRLLSEMDKKKVMNLTKVSR
jgi:hypothetical protein